jgi:hypothetical protein
MFEIIRNNGTKLNLLRHVMNGQKMFDPNHFCANFKMAFSVKSIKEVEFSHIYFGDLDIKILYDIVEAENSSITEDECSDFRFLTCLFFALLYFMKLSTCKCYPTTYTEWVGFNAGITKNCTSNECRQHLEHFPEQYDPEIHYDCSTMQGSQFVFTMMEIFAKGNFKISINSDEHALEVSNKQ